MATNITSQERTNILKLVAGMFDAAPGAQYLEEFTSAFLALGNDYAALATALGNTSAFKSQYPSSLTVEETANKFLGSLGLANNTEAQDFVQSKLNAGEGIASVVFQALQALVGYAGDDAELQAAQTQLANKAAVAEYYSVTLGASSDQLAALQGVVANVTADPASVEAAKEASNGSNGKTYTLTTSLGEQVNGTAGNDTIHAVLSNTATQSTLNVGDLIDGKGGNDALKLTVDTAGAAPSLPAGLQVSNVENIEITNGGSLAAAIDASAFVGATTIKQVASAQVVQKLAATTTASFASMETAGLTVTADATAASANVALDNVKTSAATANVVNLTVNADAANTALAAVNVAGNIVQKDTTAASPTIVAAPAASLAMSVALGKDVQAATVNTAVKTTLTIENAAASTKNMTSVDASASTGGITYQGADAQVATIKTGAGDDVVDILTATSATVAALVETGAGKDTINVLTTGTGKVTVNAGAGDDTIVIGTGGTGSLTTAFVVDGGEGTDTLKLAGKTLIAEDIALFNAVVKNVEGVEFTGTTGAVVDASKLAFTAYTFAGNPNDKVTEASAAALTTKANLIAASTGYKIDSAADADFLTDANGGNLNITATGTGAVNAYADALTLAVKVAATATAGATTTLGGDVKSANITLTNGGNITNGDQLSSVSITTTAAPTTMPAAGTYPAENNWALTSLTLAGNGSATVVNTNGKLATVDASALGGTLAFGANAGNVTGGLTYTGSATVAETIKLGSGADIINVASTYDKLDTIEGFDAKKETSDMKSVIDTINFGGVTLNGASAGQATKVTLSANATTLDLAFVEAAAANTGSGVSFFQFDGNTYLFQDVATGGTAGLDATDLAVKIVGAVDFAAAWGVYAA